MKSLRKAAKKTQAQVAEAMGLSKSGYVKIEDGVRRLNSRYIALAAKALGVREAEIIEEDPRQVSLVGYVGAGAETHRFADGQGPFDMVSAPDGASENTVAVEVRGLSLGPAFDGWYVYYDEVRDPPTASLLGRLCVVGLADGRVLVKILRTGHLKGRYTLESNVGELPIYDAEVLWAARVRHMTPK
ncbi:MAG: helix-turn-helix domain-containing protein [Methylocystis sp.]|uniref:helix-turn-helix domain-containing protein n=1 Tax=Methylocystis sp. TaxID=1911079 RepID=UPI003DA465D2